MDLVDVLVSTAVFYIVVILIIWLVFLSVKS